MVHSELATNPIRPGVNFVHDEVEKHIHYQIFFGCELSCNQANALAKFLRLLSLPHVVYQTVVLALASCKSNWRSFISHI